MESCASSRRPYYLGVALALMLGAAILLGVVSPSGLAQEPLYWNWLPVVAKPQPTPTLTPTATPLPPKLDVRVEGSCSKFKDGSTQDPNGEFVCFKNYDWQPADMTGWRVQDASQHTYFFPAFVLSPGAIVRLHSGPGADTGSDIYWGSGLIWNNTHDTAYLYDRFGRLVSRYVY